MVLRIATDCSGIEAPIQALKDLKINFKHVWSCEKDKYCVETIKANFKPEIIYEDITTRDNTKLPRIDAYVCGFPCQPFSVLGLHKGEKDERSNIIYYCIDTIKNTKPKFFILENVTAIRRTNNGLFLKNIIKKLKNLNLYNINIDVLNSFNYGSPQTRRRLFIIGIRKDIQIKQYETPEHYKKNVFLDNILLDKTYHKEYIQNDMLKEYINNYKLNKNENWLISIGFLRKKERSIHYLNISPTLLTENKFYLLKYNRLITNQEKLLIQGFPKKFKIIVSDTQFDRQIGNAINVNVIKELFKEIFKCIKI